MHREDERPKSVGTGGGLRAWLRLGLLAALLAFAMFVIGPLGLRLPGYRQMDRFIAENDLKATAIYYTDLPEFAAAEQAVWDGQRYAPKAGKGNL